MFKCTKVNKSRIALLLVVSMMLSLTACGKAQTPLEKVMPYYSDRVYNELDLMNQNGKILTRARMELVQSTQDYYDANEILSKPDNFTDEEKSTFVANIMTMGWNLKVMQSKLSTYTDDMLKKYNRLPKDRATLKFLKQHGYNDKDGLTDYYFIINYPEDDSMQDPYAMYENMATGSQVTFTQEELESMGYTEDFEERLQAQREAAESSRLAEEMENVESIEGEIGRDGFSIEENSNETAAESTNGDVIEDGVHFDSESSTAAGTASAETQETYETGMYQDATGQTYQFIDNRVSEEKNIHLDLIKDSYYEIEFNLFDSVTITADQFHSLEVNDTIDLDVQDYNDPYSVKKYTFTKTATNSFVTKETVKDAEGNETEEEMEFAFLPNRDETIFKLYFLRKEEQPMFGPEGEPEVSIIPIKVRKFVEKRKFRVLKGAMASHTESQAYLAFNQYNELNNAVYATIEDYYDNRYYGISNVTSTSGDDIRKAYDAYQARNIFIDGIYGNRIYFNAKGYITGMHFEMAIE